MCTLTILKQCLKNVSITAVVAGRLDVAVYLIQFIVESQVYKLCVPSTVTCI